MIKRSFSNVLAPVMINSEITKGLRHFAVHFFFICLDCTLLISYL